MDKQMDSPVDKERRDDLLLRETVDELRDLFLIDSDLPCAVGASGERNPTGSAACGTTCSPRRNPDAATLSAVARRGAQG
jgi:hypothetical protein